MITIARLCVLPGPQQDAPDLGHSFSHSVGRVSESVGTQIYRSWRHTAGEEDATSLDQRSYYLPIQSVWAPASITPDRTSQVLKTLRSTARCRGQSSAHGLPRCSHMGPRAYISQLRERKFNLSIQPALAYEDVSMLESSAKLRMAAKQ